MDDIRKPGSVVRAGNVTEACYLEVIVLDLKVSGHAVVWDETLDDEQNFVEAHATHYRNCFCAKEKTE